MAVSCKNHTKTESRMLVKCNYFRVKSDGMFYLFHIRSLIIFVYSIPTRAIIILNVKTI